MQLPIVTLTTDFGLRDHYAGTMKGVILSRCPDARLVDITHEVPPFSILAGAYAISQAAPFFPNGTVHVVVVDPGVGTERKALLVEAMEQYFIAPDNGVLSLVMGPGRETRTRELTNRSLWLPTTAATFHGRDVFAAVAGLLAAGKVVPEETGPECGSVVRLPSLTPVKRHGNSWQGTVLSVDRFGNLITDFRVEDFRTAFPGKLRLLTGTEEITELRATFSGAPPGVCFTYPGSSGYLEIGMVQRSAAERLSIQPGDPLTLDFHD